ncbi:DNA glycosylase, partial [Rhizodiscina lignyota]
KKLPTEAISGMPFPSTKAERFGLIQEELAHEPFKLIVAVIFLNQTTGKAAIPMFRKFIDTYPTIDDIANASVDEIATLIEPLGLQNNRAKILINLARTWLSKPPTKGKRYKTPQYPTKTDSNGIKLSEVLADDDERIGAFEVGHLPGCGPYALDSWRIFCRDKCRDLAAGWNGEGAAEGFQPEWMRVRPTDKELRAYLRWMWLKEGFIWDWRTGETEVASKEELEKA